MRDLGREATIRKALRLHATDRDDREARIALIEEVFSLRKDLEQLRRLVDGGKAA